MPTRMNLAKIMDRAVKQHSAGNLREAEKLYRQILKVQPHQPDALHLLGVIAFQVGQYKQAVQNIRSALKERPRLFRGVLQPGTRLADGGEPGEARLVFGKP